MGNADPSADARFAGQVPKRSPARRKLRRIAIILIALLAIIGGGAFLWQYREINGEVTDDVARSQLTSLPNLLLVPLEFLLFFAPGAAALLLLRRWRPSPINFLMACVTASALLGYAAFWVYFLDYRAGRCLMVVVALVGLWGLAWRGLASSRSRDSFPALLANPDIRLPLTLMFLAAMFYAAFFSYFDFPVNTSLIMRHRLSDWETNDNILPLIFAFKLFLGADPRALVGDWLSSDRPPLQTGITLLHVPFGIFGMFRGYQILATICQCIWIPAVWSLCRTMNVSIRRTSLVVLLCMFSGFFLVNSVYVWPKLLAGSLVVWAFSLLWQPLREGRKPALGTTALAALAAVLGYLAHGGVAFTLLAMAFFFLLPRYFIGARQALVWCAVFAAIHLPWSLYQKYYEPPANRLLKWHLAGVIPIDSRTTWEALRDQYGSLSIRQIAANKLDNLERMLPGRFAFQSLRYWREAEFYLVVPAIGALNLAWLAFSAALASRRWTARDPTRRDARAILCLALLAIVIWVLLFFGGPTAGDTTIVHQNSYATMILIYVGLSMLALTLHRLAIVLVFALQIADFVVTWLATTPSTVPWQERLRLANIPMITTSLLALAAIVAVVVWDAGRVVQEE